MPDPTDVVVPPRTGLLDGLAYGDAAQTAAAPERTGLLDGIAYSYGDQISLASAAATAHLGRGLASVGNAIPNTLQPNWKVAEDRVSAANDVFNQEVAANGGDWKSALLASDAGYRADLRDNPTPIPGETDRLVSRSAVNAISADAAQAADAVPWTPLATATGVVQGLAPAVAGAPGMALMALDAGGNRRQTVLEHGGSEEEANLAGAAEGGVMAAAPGVAGAAVGPLAGKAGLKVVDAVGTGALGRMLGGAAQHGVTGAATGELMTTGSAGVTAATEGVDPAVAEWKAGQKSALGLGGISALTGTVSGAAEGRAGVQERLDASRAPTGILDHLATPAEPTGVLDHLVDAAPAPEAAPEAPADTQAAPEAAPVQSEPVHVEAASALPEAPGGGVQQPTMITKRMENELRGLGYSEDDIRRMTPVEANDVLENGRMAAKGTSDARGDAERPGTVGEPTPAEARAADVPAPGVPPTEPVPVADAGRAADLPPMEPEGRAVQPAGAGDAAAPARANGDVAVEPRDTAAPTAAEPRPRRAGEPPVAPADEPAAARTAGAADQASAEPPAADAAPASEPLTGASTERATSARPDLAIPFHEKAAREATAAVDATRPMPGEDVRSHASQREAAAERLAADPLGEARRAIAKVKRGEALNEVEQHILAAEAVRHLRAGDAEEFARHMNALRDARKEGARAQGALIDPNEPPHKRAARETAEEVFKPSKEDQAAIDAARKAGDHEKAAELTEKANAQANELRDFIVQSTGVDPMKLDEAPKKSGTVRKAVARAKVTRATLEVDREFGDLKQRWQALMRGKGAVSPPAILGEHADILSKMIANRIKKLGLKAAAVALDLVKAIPELAADPNAQKLFAEVWKKQTGQTLDDPMSLFDTERQDALDKLAAAAARVVAPDKVGEPRKPLRPEIQAILDTAKELEALVARRKRASAPAPTLDERVNAARDKLADAIDRHAEAMNTPDAERAQQVRDRRAKEELPPELKPLADKIKRLNDAVRKRDAKLVEPTIDDKLAKANADLAEAAERHLKAMGQSPAERLAEIQRREDAKEPIHPELKDLLARKRKLDAEVKARDKTIYRNAMRVHSAARVYKADWWDKADEIWRGAMHTSLGLPAFKIGTDTANKVMSFISDDFFNGAINDMLRLVGANRRGQASLADIPYIRRALKPSILEGLHHALESVKLDENTFQADTQAEHQAKAMRAGKPFKEDELHSNQHAVSNNAVRLAANWNLRGINGLQAGAESAFARMAVAAEAHRTAYDADGNRLTGTALAKHMQEQIGDKTSPAWTKAIETARDDTNTTPIGKNNPLKYVLEAKRKEVKNGLDRTVKTTARVLSPFVTVPYNIIARGVMRANPVGTALTISARGLRHFLNRARGKEGTYDSGTFTRDIARHALSWGLTAVVASLMYDKDGKRRITGYHYDPKAADQGAQAAHTVRFFGTEWDYGKVLGPAGHAMGFIADGIDAVHSAFASGTPVSGAAATKKLAETALEHITDESLLRTIGDLARATRSEPSFAKYTGTLASSVVPTIAKQVSKATDDTIPGHRAKTPGFFPRVAQTFDQQLNTPGERVPAVDLFGHEEQKDDPIGGPVMSTIIRTAVPMRGAPADKGDDAQKYRDAIAAWNKENPGDPMDAGTPEPHVEIKLNPTDKKKTQVPLTEQQLHDMNMDAGERTMVALKQFLPNLDPAHPTKRDIVVMRAQIKRAQEGARGRMTLKVLRDTREAEAKH